MNATGYPALGFDPAPGMVARVTEVATNLDRIATEMGQAHSDLTTLGTSDGFWAGKAADAFKGTVGELPDYLDKANQSFGKAANTLSQWADDLGTMQRKAVDFEQQAEQAAKTVEQTRCEPEPRTGRQDLHRPGGTAEC
ncbi:MAG: putative T7SS-secreted protein [Sciscionella sp.]